MKLNLVFFKQSLRVAVKLFLCSIIFASAIATPSAMAESKPSLSAQEIVLAELAYLTTLEKIKPHQKLILDKLFLMYEFFVVKNEKELKAIESTYHNLGPYETAVLYKNLPYAKFINESIQMSHQVSTQCYGLPEPGRPVDGFRHILWSALLTFKLGKEASREITTAREKRLERLEKQKRKAAAYGENRFVNGEVIMVGGSKMLALWTTADSQMDLYNNYLGRELAEEIAGQNYSLKEAKEYFVDRILEMFEAGEVFFLLESQSHLNCNGKSYKN